MPLWPISGRTLATHVLHLWSLGALLGIVTMEDIQSRSIDWLVAGVPVKIAFINASSAPLRLAYLGPEGCWYQGSIPNTLRLGAGKTSKTYEAEALIHRCKGDPSMPFFSVWINKGRESLGPVSIVRTAGEQCRNPEGAPCLRAITRPSGVQATVLKDGGAWKIRLSD